MIETTYGQIDVTNQDNFTKDSAMNETLPDIIRTDRGVQLRTMEDAMRFAHLVSASSLAPRTLDTPEKIFVALQHGAEVGLAPMQSLQSIAVINGKPSLYGDALPALGWASGKLVIFEEWFASEGDREAEPKSLDDTAAYCLTQRKGQESARITKFSVRMAKTAKLWGKSGPWTQYPQRMLQMRARSWNFRDNLADVLSGLAVHEEAQDIPQQVESRPALSLKDLGGTVEGCGHPKPADWGDGRYWCSACIEAGKAPGMKATDDKPGNWGTVCPSCNREVVNCNCCLVDDPAPSHADIDPAQDDGPPEDYQKGGG
jgi:hypothetical protein